VLQGENGKGKAWLCFAFWARPGAFLLEQQKKPKLLF